MAVIAGLPIPPSNVPIVDVRTGDMHLIWKSYFQSLQAVLAATPPTDASYWTSTANPILTNETNLGALASGYLKILTALGVATPSTTPTIPLADISPAPPPSNATYWTSTSEPALSAETNLGALASGYLKQVTAAGVATPSTTPTIPATDISPAPPPSNAPYWTSTAVAGLSAETNLGALATGYLKQTTAAGVATPSTTVTIPLADLSPAAAPAAASYWTATAEPGLSGETNMGALTSGWLRQDVFGAVAFPAAVPGRALTGINDTNVTITLTGLPAFALLENTTLTLGWTGLLGVARGGTAADNTTQVYTPTLTFGANIASATAHPCQYLRVGQVVTVSGFVDLSFTAPATLTSINLSLPIPSVFTGFEQCGGTACHPNVFGYVGAFIANVGGNNTALIITPGATITSGAWFFSFTYQVV
jgi:hypothetical protein